jgi:hypothetical protein
MSRHRGGLVIGCEAGEKAAAGAPFVFSPAIPGKAVLVAASASEPMLAGSLALAATFAGLKRALWCRTQCE